MKKSQLSCFFFVLALSACVSQKELPTSNERSPAQSAAVSFEHPEWLPQNLEMGESWVGGSRQSELRAFVQDAQTIAGIQSQLTRFPGVKHAPRVFHDKQHACMVGEVVFDNDKNDIGIFSGSPRAAFPVLVRYSNGLPVTLPDVLPDFRGMSVKIFGLEDKNNPGVKTTVDLTSFTSTIGIGSTQRDTVNFLKAFFGSKTQLAEFLRNNRSTFHKLVEVTIPYYSSLARIKFNSGHNYLLKPGVPMKYTFVPRAGEDLHLQKLWNTRTEFSEVWLANRWWDEFHPGLTHLGRTLSPNYLAEEITARAKKENIVYDVVLQVWNGPGQVPVEDAMLEWTPANSKSFKVGELTLPRQNVHDPALEKLCHSSRFTPAHQVSQNRPLGSMGRGRVFTYFASSWGRGAAAQDPTPEEIKAFSDRLFLK